MARPRRCCDDDLICESDDICLPCPCGGQSEDIADMFDDVVFVVVSTYDLDAPQKNTRDHINAAPPTEQQKFSVSIGPVVRSPASRDGISLHNRPFSESDYTQKIGETAPFTDTFSCKVFDPVCNCITPQFYEYDGSGGLRITDVGTQEGPIYFGYRNQVASRDAGINRSRVYSLYGGKLGWNLDGSQSHRGTPRSGYMIKFGVTRSYCDKIGGEFIDINYDDPNELRKDVCKNPPKLENDLYLEKKNFIPTLIDKNSGCPSMTQGCRAHFVDYFNYKGFINLGLRGKTGPPNYVWKIKEDPGFSSSRGTDLSPSTKLWYSEDETEYTLGAVVEACVIYRAYRPDDPEADGDGFVSIGYEEGCDGDPLYGTEFRPWKEVPERDTYYLDGGMYTSYIPQGMSVETSAFYVIPNGVEGLHPRTPGEWMAELEQKNITNANFPAWREEKKGSIWPKPQGPDGWAKDCPVYEVSLLGPDQCTGPDNCNLGDHPLANKVYRQSYRFTDLNGGYEPVDDPVEFAFTECVTRQVSLGVTGEWNDVTTCYHHYSTDRKRFTFPECDECQTIADSSSASSYFTTPLYNPTSYEFTHLYYERVEYIPRKCPVKTLTSASDITTYLKETLTGVSYFYLTNNPNLLAKNNPELYEDATTPMLAPMYDIQSQYENTVQGDFGPDAIFDCAPSLPYYAAHLNNAGMLIVCPHNGSVRFNAIYSLHGSVYDYAYYAKLGTDGVTDSDFYRVMNNNTRGDSTLVTRLYTNGVGDYGPTSWWECRGDNLTCRKAENYERAETGEDAQSDMPHFFRLTPDQLPIIRLLTEDELSPTFNPSRQNQKPESRVKISVTIFATSDTIIEKLKSADKDADDQSNGSSGAPFSARATEDDGFYDIESEECASFCRNSCKVMDRRRQRYYGPSNYAIYNNDLDPPLGMQERYLRDYKSPSYCQHETDSHGQQSPDTNVGDEIKRVLNLVDDFGEPLPIEKNPHIVLFDKNIIEEQRKAVCSAANDSWSQATYVEDRGAGGYYRTNSIKTYDLIYGEYKARSVYWNTQPKPPEVEYTSNLKIHLRSLVNEEFSGSIQITKLTVIDNLIKSSTANALDYFGASFNKNSFNASGYYLNFNSYHRNLSRSHQNGGFTSIPPSRFQYSQEENGYNPETYFSPYSLDGSEIDEQNTNLLSEKLHRMQYTGHIFRTCTVGSCCQAYGILQEFQKEPSSIKVVSDVARPNKDPYWAGSTCAGEADATWENEYGIDDSEVDGRLDIYALPLKGYFSKPLYTGKGITLQNDKCLSAPCQPPQAGGEADLVDMRYSANIDSSWSANEFPPIPGANASRSLKDSYQSANTVARIAVASMLVDFRVKRVRTPMPSLLFRPGYGTEAVERQNAIIQVCGPEFWSYCGDLPASYLQDFLLPVGLYDSMNVREEGFTSNYSIGLAAPVRAYERPYYRNCNLITHPPLYNCEYPSYNQQIITDLGPQSVTRYYMTPVKEKREYIGGGCPERHIFSSQNPDMIAASMECKQLLSRNISIINFYEGCPLPVCFEQADPNPHDLQYYVSYYHYYAQKHLPGPPGACRTEEALNYFDYLKQYVEGNTFWTNYNNTNNTGCAAEVDLNFNYDNLFHEILLKKTQKMTGRTGTVEWVFGNIRETESLDGIAVFVLDHNGTFNNSTGYIDSDDPKLNYRQTLIDSGSYSDGLSEPLEWFGTTESSPYIERFFNFDNGLERISTLPQVRIMVHSGKVNILKTFLAITPSISYEKAGRAFDLMGTETYSLEYPAFTARGPCQGNGVWSTSPETVTCEGDSVIDCVNNNMVMRYPYTYGLEGGIKNRYGLGPGWKNFRKHALLQNTNHEFKDSPDLAGVEAVFEFQQVPCHEFSPSVLRESLCDLGILMGERTRNVASASHWMDFQNERTSNIIIRETEPTLIDDVSNDDVHSVETWTGGAGLIGHWFTSDGKLLAEPVQLSNEYGSTSLGSPYSASAPAYGWGTVAQNSNFRIDQAYGHSPEDPSIYSCFDNRGYQSSSSWYLNSNKGYQSYRYREF